MNKTFIGQLEKGVLCWYELQGLVKVYVNV